jgi:hypothetical protein
MTIRERTDAVLAPAVESGQIPVAVGLTASASSPQPARGRASSR